MNQAAKFLKTRMLVMVAQDIRPDSRVAEVLWRPESDCQMDVTHESTGRSDDAGLGRTQE